METNRNYINNEEIIHVDRPDYVQTIHSLTQGFHVDSSDYVQVDKQDEVLKAAQSLFSKRTQTLYHWMYPSTPKSQLKVAVSLAWDTMGTQEKQFYIAQVLGKFGYLQSSVMVNPQLGGMPIASNPQSNNEHSEISTVETRNAVSSLLQSNASTTAWIPDQTHHIIMNATCSNLNSKRRGRPKGSKRINNAKLVRHERKIPRKVKSMKIEEDEFKDDPELKKELEQFQWALHLVGK